MNKQRGTAIIVALFVVGLVAIIAVTMMSRLSRDIHRTELILHHIQAEQYSEGSILWSMETLRKNMLNQRPDMIIDHIPAASPIDHQEKYAISSIIYDASGYFNLNNLTHDDWGPLFQHLLLAVEPQLNTENAHQIMLSVANWIAPTIKNVDDDIYYSKLPQPYRAPHRLMASASELRLVKGITAELYVKLMPYVTALPETTLININTASLPVLQCLSPALTAEGAKAIENSRKNAPFTSLNKFSKLGIVRNFSIPNDKIAVSSQYFLVITKVDQEKQQLYLYTMLQRKIMDKKPVITILWQSKGSM